MMTFLLTLALIAVVMGAMAIGVVISGKRLRGSCGGVEGSDCACEQRGLPKPAECERRDAALGKHPAAASLVVHNRSNNAP